MTKNLLTKPSEDLNVLRILVSYGSGQDYIGTWYALAWIRGPLDTKRAICLAVFPLTFMKISIKRSCAELGMCTIGMVIHAICCMQGLDGGEQCSLSNEHVRKMLSS